ncbi:LCP family protein [Bacillus sp. REN3]|uniref:LCP family protein n=1 Tax=Bacillus sp. REN3 TaxID=2802440 RepID=UPI001AEF0316|nr:LCP family protein [Bacillus sp. REN3]
MRSERHHYKKKKLKVRWRRVFFALFLLFALIAAAYSYFQYRAGVKDSEKLVEQNKPEYEFNGEKAPNGATNVLLLGSDARENGGSRADTIMIASYDPKKGTYKIASIMRDTYVDIPGHGMNKINAALSLGGPELLRKTIKENFNVELEYYSIVDFEGFVRLIDEAFPEGVEVNVEKRMSENIGVTIEPGVQKLDGKHLLGYVRFRQDAVGDFGRVERQQNVIKEVGKEMASIQTVPKLPKLIGVVAPYINTNMNSMEILSVGKGFLSKENRDIETLRIPVENSFADERVPGVGAVLAIDLEENREALQKFLEE